MVRTLDLAALRSFLAIVEHGGVTRAAKRLNLTQSAVSMQLKRLEEGLGHTLLDRARKGMTPTAAGEQLASYARRMLELNDEALARLTEPSFQGDLTLGAPHDVVYPHIPEVLRLFARTYPRVRVQLQSSYTSVLKDQFARGEVDVILTTELMPDPGAEVLQAGPLVWIGAPAGQAYRNRPLPLAFENGCIFRPWVQRALDDAGIPWVMAVESLSIRTVEATVAADLAVHAGIEDTLPPQLAQIEHGGSLPPLPTTYIAMYVADGPNAGLAQKLADVLRDMWRAAPTLDLPLAAE
ncbi:LysR family transcriptional regulator [Acuticoccus sediminis]|uniref:LysR family transcriptional regulator n=1 Tax=Acuticoccus sediminis TaxID=2184697 RepID=A0A8B2NWW6_9HYPH|nr:LysR family transcriptional regulator [Acuticoccus sediminis]RAI03331.1 LysR family transcriptional regulator [Acuticoccus sediminis]